MTLGMPSLSRAERQLGVAFLLTLPLVNPYIRGEGNGHYAHLRSVALDHDLDFENEFRRGDPDFVSSTFRVADGHFRPRLKLPDGRARNQWAVGPALLWAPSFLQAHGVLLLLRALGSDISTDGYSLAYRVACALATACYAFCGLLVARRAAARWAGPPAATVALIVLWLGSSLPVYTYLLPFYSHAPASFAVALFIGFWASRRPLVRAGDWVLWGALAGLMFAVEPLASALVSIAVAEWFRSRRSRAPQGAAFVGGCLLGALPHFAVKWALFGSPLRIGTLTPYFWNAPRLGAVGFAAEHGLFAWTPVLLLAVIGLIWLGRRDPEAGAPLLIGVAAYYYAVACSQSWHGMSSFGNRHFVPLTPIFLIGLAVLIGQAHARLSSALPGPVAWAALHAPLALLVAWNLGLAFQWGTGLVPRQGPVDFGVVARNQVTAVPRAITRFSWRYIRERNAVVREQERQPER